MTVQIYCDTLDRYLYYFDRGAPAVRRFLSLSLVDDSVLMHRGTMNRSPRNSSSPSSN